MSIAGVFIVLGLSIFLIPAALRSVPSVHGTSRTIALIGNYVNGWNYSQPSGPNPPVTVTQGETVIIELSSADTIHQFALDLDRDGPMFAGTCPSGDNCSAVFDTSTPTSISITAKLAPGNYTYFCTFHSSMVGNFIVQGFTTSPNPSSLTIVQGASGTSTLRLTSVNRFVGSVALSYSAPAGITATFNPTSVSVASGSSGTSQATISVANTVMTGSYTVTLTGTSGTAVQSSTVTVTASAPGSPDFTATASTISSTVSSGVEGNSTITIAPLNGFTGTVSLASTTNSTGLTCSLNPTSISGGSGASKLSCSSSTATNYLAVITCTSGALSHSATVIFHVQDFSIRAIPTSLSVTQGSTGSIMISVLALNGFSDTLSLTGRASPSGPIISFGSASITLSRGSATSSLTVSAAGGLYSSIANGNYSVNVTAVSGALSHSTTVRVAVVSPNSSGSGALNLPLAVWVSVAGVIMTAVAATVFLARRKATK